MNLISIKMWEFITENSLMTSVSGWNSRIYRLTLKKSE